MTTKQKIELHQWMLGEINVLTDKTLRLEQRRQERVRARNAQILEEYPTYEDAHEAYGCGAITERQFEKIQEILEDAQGGNELFEAKLDLLQDLYQEQKAILRDLQDAKALEAREGGG